MNFALAEYLTAQFYAWERRGRGWKVFEKPVHLEPEFIPFFGHYAPPAKPGIDTGKRPRFFPNLQEALGLFKKPTLAVYGEESLDYLEEQYPIHAYVYENTNPVTEFQLNFGSDTRVVYETMEQLLLMLSTNPGIVGFEFFGTGEKISIQFVYTGNNPTQFSSYITAYAPDVVVNQSHDNLVRSVDFEKTFYITDLGLRDEFMRPLRIWNKYEPDPLLGVISALESLKHGEFGLFQVLFQGASNPWAESIARAVTDGSGGAFFGDSADMLPLAKEKVASPLFATVVRAIGQASTTERSQQISHNIAQSLMSFHRTGSNTLIPLDGDLSCDIEGIFYRRSHRIGMILNSAELAGFVHIPDRSVVSPKLRTYSGKTKLAPQDVLGHSFELGVNTHLGQENTVTLSDAHRLRHIHLIGATGTGKSSLLLKLITQDIKQGRGITVLDPHGDLIDDIISHIPDERLKDVVLVDPSDTDYPIGLNLLSAHSDAEKVILSSDLVALFRRFATSWGDQMTSVLANAVNAILESKTGGTLIDLRRFLVEAKFRNEFLQSVDDPNIHYYWTHEFQLLRKNTVAPILTRLDTFLRPRIVRNMMAQKDGLDFGDILNSGKILLVKLAQGLIGEENSYLLGTLVVAKLHQAAQARQNISKDKRAPHFFYIDEFQNFITPSMSAILSGARKYGLGLVLAHQDLDQLARKDSELANSVLSNPAVRVCFRVGDRDAGKLEDGFAYFDSTDLQSLGIGEAIVRVGQKDHDFNLSFDLLPKVPEVTAEGRRRAVIEHSREKYGIRSEEVDEILRDALSVKRTEETKPPEPIIEPVENVPEPEKIEPVEPEVVTTETERDIESEAEKFKDRVTEQEQIREHRYIQEYIKQIGQSNGLKAVIEEPVLDGRGSVDVALYHEKLKIACEVSVTNTVDYEVHNIEKCLKAGFDLVLMISNDEEHLKQIKEMSVSIIGKQDLSRLYFSDQESLTDRLLHLLPGEEAQQTEKVNGYRVNVGYDAASGKSSLKGLVLKAVMKKKED